VKNLKIGDKIVTTKAGLGSGWEKTLPLHSTGTIVEVNERGIFRIKFDNVSFNQYIIPQTYDSFELDDICKSPLWEALK